MPLRPELAPPRATIDRRVLLACTGAVITLTSVSVAILARRAPAPPPMVTRLVPLPIPTRVEVAAPEPDPREQPNRMGTSELDTFVTAWLTDPNAPAPSIEYRRGILYAKSADDRGDDPPYPRSADPDAKRVCGNAALWLRDYLRARLAYADLSCGEDACESSAAEYVPLQRLTFHRTNDGWAIDSWTLTYEAALGREYAQENIDFVKTSIAKLAHTSCPGEPAGAY